MATELRKTGISIVGDMPWGTHFCTFYETKQDLLDILLPYFKAGVENSEFSLLVISNSELLTVQEAISALRNAVPDLDRHVAERSIEIVGHDEWFLEAGAFDLYRVANQFKEKLDDALARGYLGMRVNGSPAWLLTKNPQQLREFEQEFDRLFRNERVIASCTYPLGGSGADELLDVAHTHQFAIARRQGNWQVLETPELMQAKQEIQRLNEQLEQRVIERTSELAATNAALQAENAERKRAEAERAHLYAQMQASHKQMQNLSRQLLQVQEAERRAIASELHDEIGQGLTGLDLLLSTSQQFPPEQAQAQAQLRDLLEQVRGLALDLRPTMLDDLGVVPALVWLFERYTTQTKVSVRFEHSGLEEQRFAPDVEITAYRIVQEALTNVARHADVHEVIVRLWTDADTLSVIIVDQGRGFDLQTVQRGASSGLAGMVERAALLGGELTIESAPGTGTRLTASLPLHSNGEPPRQEHGA
jgi:signal transduction histidine kinase